MKNKKEILPPPPKRKELNDTPVKLCNEISRLFRNKRRENDTNEGVMTQHGAHLVLSTLAIKDGTNQLELVKATHLRPPTVSIIIKRMEDEGIVERRSNPDDKRSFCVYLTDAGRALDRENIESVKKIDAIALKDISEEEFNTLMLLLSKIRNNLLDGDRREINEK